MPQGDKSLDCKRFKEKIASFHSQCRDLTVVQLELTELMRLLSDSRVTSEKQKALEYDMKSEIAPYEQKIEDLKSSDKNIKILVDDKITEANKLREECVESQGQIVEANTTIDQLEAILRKVHADLEKLVLNGRPSNAGLCCEQLDEVYGALKNSTRL
ncbi:hypothetical protein KIN20_017288 [Parelaphostrongylus tenuis]|uniref:Uncharacterized protein n=1 Tax=Parelaphostrongylus tenuis TaxID=148309 RepID=A0AAD5MN07_PARTN|nr:hypothetical protein KIN20_017288 [Parelaphostrongylus tenuis]